MTNTTYDPRLLEQWAIDPSSTQDLLNRAFQTGRFRARWVGCDAAYGCDHAFLDSLHLPDGVWYFAATNTKEQVFLEPPRIISSEPDRGRGRLKKYPV